MPGTKDCSVEGAWHSCGPSMALAWTNHLSNFNIEVKMCPPLFNTKFWKVLLPTLPSYLDTLPGYSSRRETLLSFRWNLHGLLFSFLLFSSSSFSIERLLSARHHRHNPTPTPPPFSPPPFLPFSYLSYPSLRRLLSARPQSFRSILLAPLSFPACRRLFAFGARHWRALWSLRSILLASPSFPYIVCI